MRLLQLLPAFTLVVGAVASAAPEPPRLAVMPLQAKRIDPEIVDLLDALLINAVDSQGKYRPVGAADITAMIGLEKMKDVVGCTDVSCAVELSGALGVDYLLAGTVGRLGDELLIALTLIDTRRAIVIGRAQVTAPNQESEYRRGIEGAVAKIVQADISSGSRAEATPAKAPEDAAAPAAPDTVEENFAEASPEGTAEAPAAVEESATAEAIPVPPLTADEIADARSNKIILGSVMAATAVVTGVVGGVLLGVRRSAGDIRTSEYYVYLNSADTNRSDAYASVQRASSISNGLMGGGIASLGVAAIAAAVSIYAFASMPSLPAANVDVSVGPESVHLSIRF